MHAMHEARCEGSGVCDADKGPHETGQNEFEISQVCFGAFSRCLLAASIALISLVMLQNLCMLLFQGVAEAEGLSGLGAVPSLLSVF